MEASNKKDVYVAVGLVFNSRGEVLVSLRQEKQFYGGYWEFPGGKLEKGETSLAALKREFFEEVGIEILSAQPFLSAKHDYQTYFVHLDVWKIHQFVGEAFGVEGQIIKWVEPKKLPELKFLPANSFILNTIMENNNDDNRKEIK